MIDAARLDVTVIVPLYNSRDTLERAVGSVLEQTLQNFQVLIVDDGSTDGSLDVAMTLASVDARVDVIALPKNGGKARAMNHAVTLARGTWIAVLDADDRYLPSRLATLVEAGDVHGVDLVADNQHHTDHSTGRVVRAAFTAEGAGREVGLADFIAHSDPSAKFDFGILKPMVRATFMHKHALGYYPEAKLAEDYYFMMEFFAAGGRAWLVHEPLYEWTLPFSPSTRRWTGTGAGAWRYDYRNALQTNAHFKRKFGHVAAPEIRALLHRRGHDYAVMVHYLDAQRALAESGNLAKAASMIAVHPSTWPLLAKRLAGRASRALSKQSVA